MNIKLEKTKWCEVIVIVNAQQYILPDVLAELTAPFLFLIMILWLLCTAEMFFFFNLCCQMSLQQSILVP